MSAATIAAMVVCIEEDKRRRATMDEGTTLCLSDYDDDWTDWLLPLAVTIGPVVFGIIIAIAIS